ncbi:pyridoxal phosphate-dependent decarboxylase family protein [Catellatospora bangladeshensis]|uniref:Aspartate aminotransferase family protein n=1 Tax=Catellatospora bangladeshensis TaxID=310355 RepID=A0A8J3JDI3_9ACTN|nr:pyridoxal-dependent decarboxylase [Catellatospora bangladeshensis]GIF78676.1 aspartate aminotransferase family protein [Catellatospora bangladeshensis]
MTARPEDYAPALDHAVAHTLAWLASLPDRPVRPRATADELSGVFGGPLQSGPSDAAEVVDLLARQAEPGLMAMPSGRFYGWVIGGTLPAALGADWLVSAWDQNAAMRYSTPATAAIEQAAGEWLLDLLGLPAHADVGFVTGATMANFTGLAAGRQQVLADAGWDLDRDGLTGAPRIRVLVGAERHATVDQALRYLGLGAPVEVPADEQGRIRLDALADELARGSGPVILCLQAGNIHSGAYDDIGAACALAREHGAWVHVDGAFGLWAAASPATRHLMSGHELADSWATDAHKTLNVPYDCGIVAVARPGALAAAMGTQASYLVRTDGGPSDPQDRVPELSRRARGVPVWAALRSLGRSGVADLVERLVRHARALADGISAIEGATVLNDVVFTQVSVSFGDDARTREVTARLLADGTCWMSGSRWQGRDILRVSVSNWSTDDTDVAASLTALHRACEGRAPS